MVSTASKPRRGLYQPLVEDRNVRRLYRLKMWFRAKKRQRVPMTVLINRILDDFFDAQGEIDSDEGVWIDPPALAQAPAAEGDLHP